MNWFATLLLLTLSGLFASSDGAPDTFDLFLKVTEINATCKVSKEVAKGLLTALYDRPDMKLMDFGDTGPLCNGQYQYSTAFAIFGADMETQMLFVANTFHVFKIDHFQGRMPTPIFKVEYKAVYPNISTLQSATISVGSLYPEDVKSKPQ